MTGAIGGGGGRLAMQTANYQDIHIYIYIYRYIIPTKQVFRQMRGCRRSRRSGYG